jgi:regulatory protein
MQSLDQTSKQSPSLKARALRLLSRREYSRQELAAKLLHLIKQKNEDVPADIREQIEQVLNEFESQGWLSNQRFAEALVRRRSQRYGLRRVTDELQRAGIEAATITRLSGELDQTEFERAKALWSRKFGEIPLEQKERARQYRFLVTKGFSPELVNKLISGRKISK